MLTTVSSFLREKRSKLRKFASGWRRQESQSATKPGATEPDALPAATFESEESFTVAYSLPRLEHSENDSVSLVIHTIDELTAATADRPLCSSTVLIFGQLWQLQVYMLGTPDHKLNCLLHCALDAASETVFKIACTLRAISVAEIHPCVSAESEQLLSGSQDCCALHLRNFEVLFGPSKDAPVKIEAHLASVTPVTVTTAADPRAPAFQELYADEESFAEMTALLRKETEARQHLERELEQERANRVAAEAFADDVLQGLLEEMKLIVSELREEFEAKERTQQVPHEWVEQIKAKDEEVAALKAKLLTEAHFRIVRQSKIRELHEEIANSELVVRQLNHMLSVATERHEDCALELHTTQGTMRKLEDALELQRQDLEKYAIVENSIRKEITELRLHADIAHRYHEEQTAALREQLKQAEQAQLAAYAASIDDELKAVKELRELVSTLEGQVSCMICMDQQRSVSFDCGHTACGNCAVSLRQCHICRHPIEERHTIYL
ncbi:E3 ubiquitin-protein ligase MIB2-like protein [Aphelenchoides avenae]|nr:E3 ubiquitin-protein ligase MIB2-like protein [Aphelenchus avenae]